MAYKSVFKDKEVKTTGYQSVFGNKKKVEQPVNPQTPVFNLNNLENYKPLSQSKTAVSTPSIILNPVLKAELTKEAVTSKESPLVSKLGFKGKSQLEIQTEAFQQSLNKGLKENNPVAKMMVTTGITAENLAKEQVKADAKGKVYQLGQALQYALPTPGIVPGEGAIVSKAKSILKDKEMPKIEVVEPPKSPETVLGDIKPTETTLAPKINPQEDITESLTTKTGKVAPQGEITQIEPIIPKVKAPKVKTEVPKVEPVKVERIIGTPAVSKRIETQTIEKGLIEGFKDIPDYEKVSKADQAIKVREILDTDPNKAIRIALGQELPTNGALPESVFMTVKNNALETGNTDLLVKLATEEGGVARESTVLGQRIKMLDEANPDDAFTNIKRVVNERRGTLEQKTGKKMGQILKEETTKIKDELNKVKPKKDAWLAFVDEIQC